MGARVHAEMVTIGIATAVLVSYWYSHLAERFRIPSVVLLLLTGLAARVTTHNYGATVVPSPELLPTLATTGLVLIVLEGALDLRLEGGRRRFLLRTFSAAALGVALSTVLIAVALTLVFGMPRLPALLVAAPFGVISSAVAIPSAQALGADDREFVIYESSWSDILGVMLFNALLVAVTGGTVSLTLFGGGLAVLLAGAAIALAVYWLVGHLEGHVKFGPLLFALILVYAAADALHLSPLLIVLILGLVLNNPQQLHRFRLLQRLHSPHYDAELARLKHLTAEATFLVRTFFFLLLGYVTDLAAFADLMAWAFALGIVALVLAVRWLTLRMCQPGQPVRPLLWLAPRGLITATLFFATPAALMPAGFPPATLILVVLLSCVLMAVGLRIDTAAAPAAADALPAAGQAQSSS